MGHLNQVVGTWDIKYDGSIRVSDCFDQALSFI